MNTSTTTSAAFPRQFVAENAALEQWSIIEPYFDALCEREIDSPESLEAWLVDYSELIACIAEVGTDRHVKMTCQTDSAECKQAFLDFVENIEPHVKKCSDKLDNRYIASEAAAKLPQRRYAVLDRMIRSRVDLFRENNVALQTEEAKLEQRYQEICGARTVEFDGREQTLPQLAVYAESTDRSVRQGAWEVGNKRRLEDREMLDDLFDEMVQLRDKIARNADCADYREYAFEDKQRFDYTPADCLAFHNAVEKAVVPALRSIHTHRKSALNVDPLRPWDLAVDVEGREPLHPFADVDELCGKAGSLFERLHQDFGHQFQEMRSCGHLDLQSRKGKAPGGYQATYEEGRHPFIFMNAVGVPRDVRTLIHEAGHAFHCLAARHDPLLPYRSSPIEFAEVASFGMEMLALDYLDEFYDADDLVRAKRSQLEGIVALFPWVATIDAFQHFIYTHPSHTRQERQAAWLGLIDRFGGLADYTGYEEALASAWHQQLHLFEVPFYYIEYGIAKLGALQIWRNARQDPATAVEKYRQALALGGSRPLPKLFEAAGAKFDFTYETLAPLMEMIQADLQGFDGA